MTSLIDMLESHKADQAVKSLHDAIKAINGLPVPAHYLRTEGRKDAVEEIRKMIADIRANGLREEY